MRAAAVGSPSMTPSWSMWRPRGRVKTTTGLSLDGDGAVALLVVVGEGAFEGLEDVGGAFDHVALAADHGVFEVEHDAGCAGVEHLDDELGVVGGAGHLVALVLAPVREVDAPAAVGGVGGGQVVGEVAAVGAGEGVAALGGEVALTGGEALVEGAVEGEELAGEQVCRQVRRGPGSRRRWSVAGSWGRAGCRVSRRWAGPGSGSLGVAPSGYPEGRGASRDFGVWRGAGGGGRFAKRPYRGRNGGRWSRVAADEGAPHLNLLP